jgi:hypothetical protein
MQQADFAQSDREEVNVVCLAQRGHASRRQATYETFLNPCSALVAPRFDSTHVFVARAAVFAALDWGKVQRKTEA